MSTRTSDRPFHADVRPPPLSTWRSDPPPCLCGGPTPSCLRGGPTPCLRGGPTPLSTRRSDPPVYAEVRPPISVSARRCKR